MKKSSLILALGFLAFSAVGVNATTPIKRINKKTVELYTSQGFCGPEQWDRQVLPIDGKGYITIFNGQNFDGWRGYGKSYVPSKWKVEDGCITFLGKDAPKNAEGGDIIFAHKFKNFELELEWKVAKGSNSGIFYLAQELTNDKGDLESIVVSAPEYQVLDNENHPDAKLGVNGNRKSASLYDLIPARPQNSKPYGQWNKAKIRVENGTVTHYQNGKAVVQYQLWTPEWTQMLQKSKFSESKWPAAFKHFNNCGGDNHEGLIGLQDHGDRVWYRNIRVREL